MSEQASVRLKFDGIADLIGELAVERITEGFVWIAINYPDYVLSEEDSFYITDQILLAIDDKLEAALMDAREKLRL